jgi:rod shape-determining protein MreC
LKFKRELIYSSVAAGVVGRNPSSWNEVIIINKGERDGIKPGMAVVNASGVVGKISEVTAQNAKVILLTDSNFSVSALVKRSREVGLVSGTLQGLCRMRYLSSDADIYEGDQVITSKLSSSFPGGLLVGEVVKVKFSESSPTVDCIIRPAVSLTQIEEVLVIQNNSNL